MANSFYTIESDGVTTTYPISFTGGYLSRDHVQIYIEGNLDSGGDQIYESFTWISDSMIELDNTPTSGDLLVFRRTVTFDSSLVDITPGALKSSDVATNDTQAIMLIQELKDGRLDSTIVNDLDMGGNRITNLGEPQEDNDAVRRIDLDNAGKSAVISEEWATKQDGLVQGIDYSSKAHAIGGVGTENNNAKYWAMEAALSAEKIGQEQVVLFYNGTGADIVAGQVLHPLGGIDINGSIVPTVELAIADDHEKCQGTLFIANETVVDGTVGQGQRFGKVRHVDTTSLGAGQQLWLSCDTPGALTTVKPQFPCYSISLGGTLSAATDGEIFVSITTGVEDTIADGWDGAVRETFDFRTSSDGLVITGILSNPNVDNDNLTLIFSTGFHTLELPANNTITLVEGTATNPQLNYVYIPEDTKVLTVSTSGFPVTEHCKIAKLYLKDAVSTQTDGALRNQNINDHIKTDDDNGHILHMAERLRTLPAEWENGIEASLTVSGTPSDVWVSTTAGKVWQLHQQDFNVQDMSTGDDIHIVNDPTTPYRTTQNLNDLTVDAEGGSINNVYTKIVIWGVANKTGEISHLMCNLPRGTYNSEVNALEDVLGYADYSIPIQFKGVGFLIGAFVIRKSGTTFTYGGVGSAYQDLRGLSPNSTAGVGGGASGITTFAGLQDTPSSYIGNSGKSVVVNSAETGLEFSGYQFIHVRDQRASGTYSGDSIVGTQLRELNTTVGVPTIVGASLGLDDKVTLPAGTYQIYGTAGCSSSNGSKLSIYNFTTSSTILSGQNYSAVSSNFQRIVLTIVGEIILTEETEIGLNHYIATARLQDGLGSRLNMGDPEIYADLLIEKVG